MDRTHLDVDGNGNRTAWRTLCRGTLAAAGIAALLAAGAQAQTVAPRDPSIPVETALLPAGPVGDTDAAVPLPAILSQADVEAYRRIFAVQKDGRWRAADAEIKKLKNRMLLGHVLAQRYLHPTKYRSRYHELKAWLDRYADLPEASRIYKLALHRKGHSAPAPRRPIVRSLPALDDFGAEPDYRYVSKQPRSSAQRRRAASRIHVIRRDASSGRLSRALRILSWKSTRRMLDPTERAIARVYIASGYYFRGSAKHADRLVREAVGLAGPHMPMANWIAGLSAYRLGRYAEAAGRFEAMAGTPGLSPWTAAAATFWAARANLVAERPAHVTEWLRKSAGYERTFYGLLAGRVLGIDRDFDWKIPVLTASRLDALLRHPAGKRALALLQIGSHRRAERELLSLTSIDDRELGEALLALADAARLPSLSLRTAAIVVDDDGAPPDGALYPVPFWRPEEGFLVDRALIYAFMRQESRFNARAKSSAGARGLMQLMPATAGFMARKRFRGKRRALLYDPQLNISLGQRYIRYLIDHDSVNGNVLMLAAAYNGGPGNVAKWRRRAEARNALDPLLFIESIPASETRIFIERVLANLWIYRSRLGQASPSLDRLAAGQSPFYKSLDGGSNVVADNAQD